MLVSARYALVPDSKGNRKAVAKAPLRLQVLDRQMNSPLYIEKSQRSERMVEGYNLQPEDLKKLGLC